ncbi:MAG: 30S ribosomal protein S8 [Candidatus Paceibacterota bacterium]
MLTDPIADMITRIRNAQAVKKETVYVYYSNLKWAILEKLVENGYLKNIEKYQKKGKKIIKITLNYENGNPVIHEINRVSKPSRRIYSQAKDLFPFKGGKGIRILSTPKGVLTDKEAKKMNVGGEVLIEVW